MRLLYLTNVQIPAKDAQSIQVQAMSLAFWQSLKDNFILISPKNKENKGLQTEFRWIRLNTLNFFPRFICYFILIIRSLPYILKFKPDWIYTRDIFIVCVCKLLGFMPVYEIHKPFETKLGNFLFKVFSPKIKIIAISQNLKSYLIDNYSLKEERILVAPDGVFLEEFLTIKSSKKELKKKYLNIDNNRFVILYSGSLQTGKGVELILKIANNFRDILFVIIGGSEKEINQLKKNNIANVLFISRKPHQEIPYYLMSADLLILPLTKELKYWKYTSPLKLFEYMASRTPILASKLESLTEILNERNSFLFDPDNLNDLIEKINFIKNNYSEAKKKAEINFENVKNYTWQKRKDKILEFIKL